MNPIEITFMLIVISLIFIGAAMIYKKICHKVFFFKGAKILPNTCLVYIVRNNKQLLEMCLKNMKSLSEYITDIFIIDMGSIDNTFEVATSFRNEKINVRVYRFDSTKPNNNCFEIIKNNVNNEEIIIIDLNKIQSINPNVYIPDIFKSIELSMVNKSVKYENRINGIRLLNFDFLEREKNSYILKEYVIENLNNIHMQIELLEKNKHEFNERLESKLIVLSKYIENTIEKTNSLLNLIGSTKYQSNNTIDNLIQELKKYSQNTGISINYKMLGKKINLDNSLSNLLLSIVQDLLNLLLQINTLDSIVIMSKVSKNKVKLFLKYHSLEDSSNLHTDKYTLRYFILQSIQNRLNLVNGDLRIKLGKSNEVIIFIQFPTSVAQSENEDD